MRNRTGKLLLIILLYSLQSLAQQTTSNLSGIITDQTGAAVSGASITLKHEPTGYAIHTQTSAKGLFVAPDLKPGGPYTITISFVGFNTETLSDVNLILGDNPDLNIALKPTTNELKEVVVSAAGRRQTGGATTISRAQMNVLPTLGRSLSDFTRLSPTANNNSFAGSNFRYNNITLDGAVNNDAISFSNSAGGVSGGGQSGTSGSGTRTNPYSIDVIQEVQVQLTPYDVKLGNFTGGSVNAVTKSGTNDFHGSVYGYGRNQALFGKSVDGKKSSIGSDFYDYQTGATLSGAIIKNKLFFIVNGEITRRQEPTFYNAGDPGAAITLAEAQSISSFLKTTYNYDAGSYDRYKIKTNSDKLFARLDWNINSKSTLMIRGIYTNGLGNNLERSSTNFQFSTSDFTQHSKNINLVAELKTKFTNSLNNQLLVSYINVHDYRDFPGTVAPFMDIDNGRIYVGTWREASVYNTRQKTFELTDNVTLVKGKNKFTFGTHNEFYNIGYGFLNSWNGRWEYANGLNSFLASQPSRIRALFPFDGGKNNNVDLTNNLPGSNYKANLLSAYVQDEIAVSKKFKVSPGIRLDYPFLTNKLGVDTALNNTLDYVSANPTYSHTSFKQLNNDYLSKVTVSPRLGFSYDVKGNQSFIIRGGTGIFVGRMPFAWFGYASTLTGQNFGGIDYKPGGKTVGLAIDPTTLKDTVAKYGGSSASATREVDIVDNNFKLPSIWRSNIATDIKFGKGYKLTLDAMYTKTISDVKFQQINIKDSSQYYTSGPTETPYYVGGKVNGQYSNVYLLTNTSQGYRYNLTAQISKTSNDLRLGTHSTYNLYASASYTYGRSKDISNGIRNSWSSNYEVNPAINPNNPSLSYSNFDLRNRITGLLSTTFKWNPYNSSSVTFFYTGQSGSPYSIIYQSAPFGNASNASLPYIPASRSDINLADVKDGNGNVTYSADQQWADLSKFIDNDTYLKTRKGNYAERNALRTPWNHTLDLKLLHEFKFKGSNKQQSIVVSFDLFNVLNLLNNSWGHINFVTNVNNYTVNFLKFVKDANGKAAGSPASGYIPTFQYQKPTSNGQYYTVDPINSRWQGQFGIKYNF
jgi:hypothetical protein